MVIQLYFILFFKKKILLHFDSHHSDWYCPNSGCWLAALGCGSTVYIAMYLCNLWFVFGLASSKFLRQSMYSMHTALHFYSEDRLVHVLRRTVTRVLFLDNRCHQQRSRGTYFPGSWLRFSGGSLQGKTVNDDTIRYCDIKGVKWIPIWR